MTREPEFESDEDEAGSGSRNDGRLRSANLDDGQPALTWWLPLPGIALALVWAAYQAVSADEPDTAPLLDALVWPGAAIFVITTVTAYFGWRLDLD